MGPIAIDTGKIQAMMAQLQEVAARAKPASAPAAIEQQEGSKPVDFGAVLKKSLDQVNQTDLKAQEMAGKFTAGDDTVSLSDVMISAQKANISLQTAIQVRNRFVTAYQNIMNMQV